MLVKITSANENEFIKTEYLTGQADYWIGLSDSGHEGAWKWTDGTLLTSDGFKDWGGSQPNGGTSQNCARMRLDSNQDAEWHDKQCSHTKGFICEK